MVLSMEKEYGRLKETKETRETTVIAIVELLHHTTRYLLRDVDSLLEGAHKKDLDDRVMDAAVNRLFPRELAAHALSEGRKAVKYNKNIDHLDQWVSTVCDLYPKFRDYTIHGSCIIFLVAVLEYLVAEIIETGIDDQEIHALQISK